MSVKNRIQTSKVMLWLVVLVGLGALCYGVDPSQNQLVGYGLILAVAIFNRFDSRRQGYKVSAKAGPAAVTIETGGKDGCCGQN